MTERLLTDRDRAFLARHRKLADDRPARGSADMIEIAGEVRDRHLQPASRVVKSVYFHDGTRGSWLPAKFVSEKEPGVYEMPEWLAKDRGFI